MNDSCNYAGHAALITGAAGGIGSATAALLARRGARVLLTDRDADGLRRVAEALEGDGADVGHFAADLSDPDQVEALYAWSGGSGNGVDWLVNNAGVLSRHRLEAFPDDDWDRVLAINLTALYRTTKLFARDRIGRKLPGSIVNLSSMAYRGMTQQIAYSTSKGGVVTLTKSSALELARHGIRANAVAPGMIETQMIQAPAGDDASLREKMLAQIPLRRYGAAPEIAETVAFLLSDAASYMTGEVLHVSGGARL